MIADPALRPPLRFALLAAALVMPVLALAGLGAWALRQDRRAAEAELRLRSEDVARAIQTRLESLLTPSDPGDPPTTSARHLVLDSENRLAWPPTAPWPPIPQPVGQEMSDLDRRSWQEAESAFAQGDFQEAAERFRRSIGDPTSATLQPPGNRLQALACLREAQALHKAGRPVDAITSLADAFACRSDHWVTEAGLGIRVAALHAILDLVGTNSLQLPAAWRDDPKKFLQQAADLPTTPATEDALRRLLFHLPALASANPGLSTLTQLEAPLRQREFARRVFAVLHSRNPGVEPRPWPDLRSFVLDRESWIAVRVLPKSVASREEADPNLTIEGSQRYFALIPWRTVFDEARRVRLTLDTRAQFGMAVRLATAEGSVFQEEPVGIEGRATSRIDRSPVTGALLTVATAPVDPETFFTTQRDRERTLGALIFGAVLIAVVAGVLTWLLLVRQHRLGVQKSNLVASVSHELRAPLASVRLLADNLETGRVTDPERRLTALRLIGRECRRLSSLVDNVLDLSRIERGRRRHEPEPTDLPALVRETIRLAAVGAEERGITLHLDLAPAAIDLVATVDGAHLQQSLANLIDNAVKHSPANAGVLVALDLTEDQRAFRLTVSDSGPGIPPSERTRVFEPFHRLGSELRREHAGIGLGLAIVRHTAQAHGGKVWIEDARPSGTRVVLQLPLASRETPPPQSPAS